MKGNRDMFYGNYQAGAFQDPNVFVTPPSGYNINTQYQAFGPNLVNQGQVPMQNNNNYQGTYVDEYDQRITKLERQIRSLDQRIRKLETGDNFIEDNTSESNMYMI